MNKTPLISVIIPVYNTNLFLLKRCFDSINNQSYRKIEIIIVDSSDESEICKYVANYKFNFEHVLKVKSEKGVSLQRNIGIENSAGEFISFIDSDDMVNEDYFLELLSNIQEAECDIAFPLIKKEIFKDRKIIKTWDFKHEDSEAKIDEITYFDFSERNAFVHPIKLYKRSLIGSIRFDEKLIFGEDLLFNYSLAKKHPKVIFSGKAIYSYTSEDNTNLIQKHLNPALFAFLDKIIQIYKEQKRMKIKKPKVLHFFNEPFLNFYYFICKKLSIRWIFLSIRYRIFYLIHNISFKNITYMIFPVFLFSIKKIFKRV